MSILKVSAAILCLSAGLLNAQGQMPLSKEASVYRYDPRGMSFDAPVNFTITGLRVPDPVQFGFQSVAVYVLKTHTPGTQTAPTPTFWSGGTKSSTVIACNISAVKGDHVIIIGCAHKAIVAPATEPGAQDTSTSYGVGNFTTNILGNPVQPRRVTGSRTTWYVGKGKANITTTASAGGSWGRTEVYIKGQKPWLVTVAKTINYGAATTTAKNGGPNAAYMGISAHASNYNSTYTRGFYFQAPVDFEVIGMRVPAGNTTVTTHQAVTLWTTATMPVAYPATTAITATESKFFAEGLRSAGVLKPAANIKIKKGTWVGVMGAAYNTTSTTNYNSYGAGSFVTNIMGQPVTINRIVYQGSMRAVKGIGNYSTENSGSIGRVELHIKDNEKFNNPIVGKPSLTTSVLPLVGTTAKLEAVAGVGGAQGGVLLLSSGRAPGTGIPTPFGTLHVLPNIFWTGFLTAGGGAVSLPIPNDPKLLNVKPTFQTMVWYLGKPLNVFGMSNGTEWTIGNF